jgi:hypothetical protein
MRGFLLIILILIGLCLYNANKNNSIPQFTDEINNIICIQEEV